MTARRIGELLLASTAIPAIAPPDEAVCACVSKFKPQNNTRTNNTRNAESFMPSTPRHESIVAPPLRRSNRRKSSSCWSFRATVLPAGDMADPRIKLPQGTLDLLILKTITLEPQHGWALSEPVTKS